MTIHDHSDKTEQPTTDRRNRRADKTYRKHVVLTTMGRARIDAWAADNDLNFSAAIETLALLGLADERSDYIIPALRETTRQGLALALNRLSRLLYDIALEAATGRTVAEGLLLQLIRQTAEQHPDDFESVLRIRRDGSHPRDVRLRRMHARFKEAVEQEAIARLRNARIRASALHDYLADEADDEAFDSAADEPDAEAA